MATTKKERRGIKRLSPADLNALLKEKGWTQLALAERWALSRVRISQLVNDLDRPRYYDDAIRGLPDLLKAN